MYRTAVVAVIALATITLANPAVGRDSGGRAGKSGPPMAGVTPVALKSGGGTATPRVKKLSGKAGAACFRACMHGVRILLMENWCVPEWLHQGQTGAAILTNLAAQKRAVSEYFHLAAASVIRRNFLILKVVRRCHIACISTAARRFMDQAK